jgi:hypothetical protein
MKTRIWLVIALLVCGAAYLWSAQDTSITQREVRDPRKLEPWLEANASDAQTRLAALEAGSSITLASNKVFIGSDSGTAAAQTLSGDASTDTNGVVTIADNAVAASEVGPGTLSTDVLLPTSVTWTNTKSIVIDGTTAVTTNQAFLSATGVTNTLVIVDGLIKQVN